ncbi:MAG: recombinase family protein [Nitrospiraceae bacterium]
MPASSSPTICGLYTRVSTRNQVDTEYSSLETQREKLEAYCKSQDQYVIYRVYEDAGFSADTMNRPALKELLHDIRTGRISCVLAYKIDRLTRCVKDFHVLMDLFDRHGAKFVSITQSLDTHHPMGRLLRNILLDFAQFEREMTADRTRDKMQQRATKGLWNGGNVPFGYCNEDKRLLKHPEEARCVQFMFQYFAQDPSLTRLRTELQRRGWRNRTGKPWGKMSLDYILRNPVYCGQIQFNEQLYTGEHEALIEEALYHKVQSLTREHTRAETKIQRTFLLKGLLKCSVCRSVMTPHYTQKRRKDNSINRIAYYRCTKTMHHNNAVCTVKNLNANDIERQVIEYLASLNEQAAWVKTTVEDLNRVQKEKVRPLEREAIRLRAGIDKLEREIDRLVGPTVPFLPALSRELADVTTECLGLRHDGTLAFDIVGQTNHGVCAVAQDPWAAYEHIERLDHICEIVLKSGIVKRRNGNQGEVQAA